MASGFTIVDAEALGVRFVRSEPPFLAEFRQDGAVMALDGGTLEEVLRAVEDWHIHRLRAGVAGPGPVGVKAAA
jgi:hypothetical protein